MVRQSIFRPEYFDQVRKLAALGAIDSEIADFLGIAVRTLYQWRETVPGFAAKLGEGKAIADANVERSLYRRATGYSVQREAVVDRNGEPGTISYTEHDGVHATGRFRLMPPTRSFRR